MVAEPDDLLNLAEAGEVLRVHRLVAGRFVREGKIPATRGPRREWLVRRADVDAYLLANPWRPGSTVLGRQVAPPDGREWLEQLTAAGWSDERICAEVGMRPETLARSREHGVGPVHKRALLALALTLRLGDG